MPSYRVILMVVSLLSLLVAGLSEIRNSLFLTVGLMNLCLWTFPLIEKWKKRRNASSVEGERQLQVGNYPEAEQSLILALAEAEHQRTSVKKRASLLGSLAEAQRKQGKLAPAEQSLRQAMALVAELKGQGHEKYGHCLESLAGIHQDSGNHPQEQQILQESLRLEEGLPNRIRSVWPGGARSLRLPTTTPAITRRRPHTLPALWSCTSKPLARITPKRAGC